MKLKQKSEVSDFRTVLKHAVLVSIVSLAVMHTERAVHKGEVHVHVAAVLLRIR